jgi:hypothetical protein
VITTGEFTLSENPKIAQLVERRVQRVLVNPFDLRRESLLCKKKRNKKKDGFGVLDDLTVFMKAEDFVSECKKAMAGPEKSTAKIFESISAPNSRHIPFERTKSSLERSQSNIKLELELSDLSPFESRKIGQFLTGPIEHDNVLQIGFLDLASHTAGDDWTFVNALLVKLQSIPSMMLDREKRQLPHLVIIDSVAGFETFVGTVDAYGNEQTRRSRIAQCIRNAGDRVNLLFVVEEAQAAGHLPEEFVTDIVFSMNKRAPRLPKMVDFFPFLPSSSNAKELSRLFCTPTGCSLTGYPCFNDLAEMQRSVLGPEGRGFESLRPDQCFQCFANAWARSSAFGPDAPALKGVPTLAFFLPRCEPSYKIIDMFSLIDTGAPGPGGDRASLLRKAECWLSQTPEIR